jgi:hypothetical protein
MPEVSYAVKMDNKVVKKVKLFCQKHGIKQSFFVTKALLDYLKKEELIEDLRDFKELKAEESKAIGFEEYLKNRLL